jgi:lipocalin
LLRDEIILADETEERKKEKKKKKRLIVWLIDYAVDWAIVQTQEWNTLYILSRVRQPSEESIQAWVDRAVAFGSNRSAIIRFNQTGCEGV